MKIHLLLVDITNDDASRDIGIIEIARRGIMKLAIEKFTGRTVRVMERSALIFGTALLDDWRVVRACPFWMSTTEHTCSKAWGYPCDWNDRPCEMYQDAKE